jgi:hypothetical protein
MVKLVERASGNKGGSMDAYQEAVDAIGTEYDLSSDLGRRKAFDACRRYADEKLASSVDYSYFMSLAANKLGCDPVIRSILRLVPSDGSEKITLRYTEDGGPCLSANRNGLIYLSRAFAILATSRLSGDHFHFRYHEFPMVGRSFPLTIYLDDDAWFSEFCKEDAAEDAATTEPPTRDVDPSRVRALIIADKVPEQLLMTPGNVYVVHRTAQLLEQQTWKKSIRESTERMYVFEFRNDDGELTALALDLDDQGIVFLTEENLKQVGP